MPIRAILYDAAGTDREVALDATVMTVLHDQQLLWVDLANFDEAELIQVAALLRLTPESVEALRQDERRPRLDQYARYAQLSINTVQEPQPGRYQPVALAFVLGMNLVLTVHRYPVRFIESFDRRLKGDSDLGALDAPAFLATLLDWHVTSYFRLIEALEVQVDRIDAHALQPRHSRDLLAELAALRQRVAFVRRTLTPHREVYAALTRPDLQMVARSASAAHFGVLTDRLTEAIEAVENARELLVGSFDMFTTQTTLRTNEVIKVLTLVSAVLFPASVIVGITGLLLRPPVDARHSAGFWGMLGLIVLIALFTVAVARGRKWI